MSGVKADMRIIRDHRVNAKAFIQGRVGDNQRRLMTDSVGAKRIFARRCAIGQAVAGFKNQCFGIDQCNQGNGNVKQTSCQSSQAIKTL